jgi:hypothetical protein
VDNKGAVMSNFFSRVKREIFEVIPAVIFFFIVFELLAFTQTLILHGHGIEVSTFLKAAIAALIIGKVILLTDLLPIMNRFPNRPLVYNIVWKTVIYMVAALLVRYAEHLIPLIFKHKDLVVANNHLLDEVIWSHFCIVQIWLLICFFMYCTVRELIRILGREKVLSKFFGSGMEGK